MPNAYIYGPKIEDTEKAYKIPRQAYVVTIIENPPENVGVGGQLIIDR